MSQVLEWIKANVFIVIFAVLMIAGLVALPILSSGMNEKVKKTVNDRADMISDVQKLSKTDVVPPQAGPPREGQMTLVNQLLLEQYRQAAEELRSDADSVVAAALAFNKKNHGVLMERVFPEMPPTEAEVLPKEFHGVVEETYLRLLEDIKAGSPPTREELAAELRRGEVNFISQSVQKDSLEDLDEDELKEMKKKLTEVRLAKNREQAEKIGLYISEVDVPIPFWDQRQIPTSAYMFNWNWEYWVVSDILMALHHANEADETVLLAPVKRVIRLSVMGLPEVTRSAPSGGGMIGRGGRMGAAGSSGSSGSSDSPAAESTPPNPSQKVPDNFGYRYTGRSTNPLYDVLEVKLDLVVDSTRIPEILDALSMENFFTMVDLKMEPLDPFAAAAEGFMYGNAPVSTIELTIDTVWLRQWTIEDMPDETRLKLGVPPRVPEKPEDVS